MENLSILEGTPTRYFKIVGSDRLEFKWDAKNIETLIGGALIILYCACKKMQLFDCWTVGPLSHNLILIKSGSIRRVTMVVILFQILNLIASLILNSFVSTLFVKSLTFKHLNDFNALNWLKHLNGFLHLIGLLVFKWLWSIWMAFLTTN